MKTINDIANNGKNGAGNADRSIMLTRIAVIILLAVSFGLSAAGPYLTNLFLNVTLHGKIRCGAAAGVAFPFVLLLGYCCAATFLVMLFVMLRFLKRLETNRVFVSENTEDLRKISRCCAIGALLTVLAGILLYLPIIFIAAAAGFMTLVVLVIKNAFEQAVIMKNELDLTI
ncbi:MAG: DUF2975 domain-containing protein [Lachnospiraceae bacterium]|jgi:hypothetical protein|nr:DUF2975 domain-containing protein [Lachnospiraceae bacterium]